MYIYNLFLKASFLVQLIIINLISFSIISWAIIIQKIKIINMIIHKTKDFENRFLSGIELTILYKENKVRRNILVGIEKIFYAGFKEFARLLKANLQSKYVVSGTARVMRIVMNRELELLESNLPILGIIGSISPYIGLLGTVWGIMHTFVALSTTVKQTPLQIVAPGIAEALITTAIGLFVAIPAVIAYNYLNQQVNKLEQSYDNFIEELLAILHYQAFANTNIATATATTNHNYPSTIK